MSSISYPFQQYKTNEIEVKINERMIQDNDLKHLEKPKDECLDTDLECIITTHKILQTEESGLNTELKIDHTHEKVGAKINAKTTAKTSVKVALINSSHQNSETHTSSINGSNQTSEEDSSNYNSSNQTSEEDSSNYTSSNQHSEEEQISPIQSNLLNKTKLLHCDMDTLQLNDQLQIDNLKHENGLQSLASAADQVENSNQRITRSKFKPQL
jgi:hypothetical protein